MKKLVALIAFVLISVLAVACVAENNSSSPDESSAPVHNESSALPEMSEEDSVPEVSDEVSEEVSEEVSDEVSENSAPTVENSTDPDVNDETSQGEGVVSLEDYLFETGSFWGQNGEWLYYVDEDGALIGRVRLDGTGRLKYENKGIISANVETDRIYYVDNNDSHLYSMNHDGSDVTLLSDDEISSSYYFPLKISDGRVYFSVNSGVKEGNTPWYIYIPCSIKTDGTDMREDSRIPPVNGWCYGYVNEYTDHRISKTRYDGSEAVVLTDFEVQNFTVNGEWIYYTLENTEGSDRGLHKIKTDGTGNQKICDDVIWFYDVNTCKLLFDGENAYFVSDSDETQSLYKIKNDGTERVQLTSKSVYHIICVRDNTIYYYAEADDSSWGVFSVGIDGTNEKYICSAFATGLSPLRSDVWVIDTGLVYVTEGGNTYFYSFEKLD